MYNEIEKSVAAGFQNQNPFKGFEIGNMSESNYDLVDLHKNVVDNVILVSPSPSFVARLPNRKLPDRTDFKHYGQDHAARIRDWTYAIGESQRMADALAQWAERPDLKVAQQF